MDNNNVRNTIKILGGDDKGKVRKLLGRDVADPWYSGDFETTYKDIYEGCKEILEAN